MSKSEVEASSGKPSLNDRTVSMMLKDAAYTIDSKDTAGAISRGWTGIALRNKCVHYSGDDTCNEVYLKNLKNKFIDGSVYGSTTPFSFDKGDSSTSSEYSTLDDNPEPKLKVQKLYPAQHLARRTSHIICTKCE